MVVHQHSLVLLFWADHLNSFELPLVFVDLQSYLINQRKRKLPSATWWKWWVFCIYMCTCVTHFGLGALGLLFLNVHGQYLAAEREALGLFNHLLVRWYSVVPHDHMALEWITCSHEQLADHKWHRSHTIQQTPSHWRLLYSYRDNSMSFGKTGLWFADYRELLWCVCQKM